MGTWRNSAIFIGVLAGFLVFSAVRRKKVAAEEHSAVWGIEESENMVELVLSIATEQAAQDAVIHRNVTCNQCGMLPLRGWRFKCGNCIDFDLCGNCEPLNSHDRTHNFIKIRIPIPPHANPRSIIFQKFYPGDSFTFQSKFDTKQLELETHFDSMEITAYYSQFLSLSTIKTDDGGITRRTFDQILGTLKAEAKIIVDRMFLFFDIDEDGIISFEEMVKGLSVLCKGTMDEKIYHAFRGYDIDGDGVISRSEFLKIFKAYFALSMDIVRGAVKVMEEDMLDNFDDESFKPVSAAFGGPFGTRDQTNTYNLEEKDVDADSDYESPIEHNFDPAKSPFDKNVSFSVPISPTLDIRPSLAFMQIDEEDRCVENLSHNAIEEMVSQIFEVAGVSGDFLTFDDFVKVVEHDVNVLAWFEALGSIF